jgi:hypothetical protein
VAAKAVIVAEVERLYWRIWNGKVENPQINIRAVSEPIESNVIISWVRIGS